MRTVRQVPGLSRATNAEDESAAAPSLGAYEPYPAYKDSRIEWLGQIPAYWEVRRLKYAARIVAGQSPPSDKVVDYVYDFPFLQGNAEFGPMRPSPRFACDEARKMSHPDDILLSVRAPVGAINIADQAYGIGRGLCAVQPSLDFAKQFAYYLLVSTRSRLNESASGSTYDAVTASDIGDLPAILPPLPEQRAIADYLDRETARIDALVAKQERLIELLRAKRAALISQAVTCEDWPVVKLHRLISRVSRPVNVRRGSTYREIGIRSWGKGIFHKEPTTGASLAEKRVFYVNPGDLVLNIVFAWEGAVAVVSEHERGDDCLASVPHI